jgi:hypothetical protein
MPKSVAIIQSNYIPWKGYFDIINMVDQFILYDDMQFTRRDWRNRNQIKTAQGLKWLTIPVDVKGKYTQQICETRIADPSWPENHWQTIRHNYAKAAHFDRYEALVADLYEKAKFPTLSEVNFHFLTGICSLLGIKTKIDFSMDYKGTGRKTERLISLCQQVGATKYISGPAAKEYMDEALFADAGIELQYVDYSGYPEYTQLHGAFTHGVSIIDLIFNEGPRTPEFMKSPLKMKP